MSTNAIRISFEPTNTRLHLCAELKLGHIDNKDYIYTHIYFTVKS